MSGGFHFGGEIGILTQKEILSKKLPGRYADRDGLYLQVSKSNTKSWIYRYQLFGKRREIGLGSLKTVPLKAAREKASIARALQQQGIDPKAHKSIAGLSHEDATWTFDRCAEHYIEAHTPSWKNSKHADQWRNTLNTYASPIIGHLPVDQVDTGRVMQVLDPIWRTKTETASRVRGRIESILAWAIVRGYRDGPNPALWRGHLSLLLPERSKIQSVRHFPALSYTDIGSFMETLRTYECISAKALEFTILTAVRTNEVIGAKWSEVDLESRMWTVPAARMKAKRPHRVPLSDQVYQLLAGINRVNDWVFPGQRKNKPLSNMAMLTFIKQEMQWPGITVHGFRSTFRDWAAEVSHFPRELAESALAHIVRDKTEAAYRRGDLFNKRQLMMQAWADFCEINSSNNIVSLKQTAQ